MHLYPSVSARHAASIVGLFLSIRPSALRIIAGLLATLPAAAMASPSDSVASGAPEAGAAAPLDAALPTIFIVGDSTASSYREGPIQGWGEPFREFFDPAKVNIANRARAGRSSRTFMTERLWAGVLREVKAGDVVLIQFGHNDGGAINEEPPGSTRPLRARGTLPGIGAEATPILNAVTQQPEVVRTFGWYLRTMIADVRAQGATPILLSTTVRNVWTNGRVERGPGSFRAWTRAVAAAEGVPFIDVTRIVADQYQAMGEERVRALFGPDHVHTNADGARVNATAVVAGLRGLRDGPMPAAWISPAGEAVVPDRLGWLNLPEPANPELPTVMIIGDSTARNGRGDGANGEWGWGEPFADLFDPAKVNIVNRAVGGTSSRTFMTLGYWERARMLLRPGDLLLIQFGHNDRSPVNDERRSRGTLPGTGEETETIDNLLTKQTETVHTFGWYLRTMIREARAVGARPVLVTPTLNRPSSDGRIGRGPGGGQYADWTATVAEQENVPLVDLAGLTAAEYERLSAAAAAELFIDGTHTNADGAALNARLVRDGLRALPGDPVGGWVREAAKESDGQ